MKYYLIAGERSGDLHGANLIKGIRKEDPNAEIRGWGGDLMQAEGMDLVTHYRDTSFMGFAEVAQNIFTIRRLMQKCKDDVKTYQPDALILIDYPGFNLRIAAFAKSIGIKVLYYISPKVWAWNQGRAWKIKKVVDKMFVIFPFEVPFYQRFDYQVDYVGNPLMDAIAAFQKTPDFHQQHQLSSQPIIALLPGSRKQEVKDMLPTMLSVIPHFPDYQFVVSGVNNLPKELYTRIQEYPQVKVIYEEAYNIVTHATAALVTSGTATLETALLGTPEVVCYKTSGISYWIAKQVIKVDYISLVNLICNREVVKELIQNEFNTNRLREELAAILPNGIKRTKLLSDYKELADRVGGAGASEKAGARMVRWVQTQTNL